MRKRKLWCTEIADAEVRNYRRHESQAAVYRYLEAARANYQCRANPYPYRYVHVRVDERDDRGWRLYEVVDLSSGMAPAEARDV